MKVSDTAIRKAIKAGRVTVTAQDPNNGRPLLNYDNVLQQWHANTDPARQPTSATGGNGVMKASAAVAVGDVAATPQPTPESSPGQEDEQAEVTQEAAMPTYNESRAMKEAFSAKQARLDYEKAAGSLVPIEQVKAEAFRLARRLRDSILSVPDRLEAELAAETNPRKLGIRLKEELINALGNLETEELPQ